MEKRMIKYLIICVLWSLAVLIRPVSAKAEGHTLQNPKIEAKDDPAEHAKVTWDCVWFGSYPQSRVKETEQIYEVLSANEDWDQNGDARINGETFRKVRVKVWTDRSEEDRDYYYRYEPVKWRVLKVSGNSLTLLADKSLDTLPFSDTDTIAEKDSWENCTIRSWLNGYSAARNLYGKDYSGERAGFLTQAFSTDEQSAILTTTCYNNDMAYQTNTGKKTKDKIFLPAEADVCQTKTATEYGFDQDYLPGSKTRAVALTEYAGRLPNDYSLRVSNIWSLRTNSYDRLRSSGVDTTGGAVQMTTLGDGFVYLKNEFCGIRPMLHLNIAACKTCMYAGTVSVYASAKGGTVTEEIPFSDAVPVKGNQKKTDLKPISGNTKNYIHFLIDGKKYKKNGFTYKGYISIYHDEADFANEARTMYFLRVERIPNRKNVVIPATVQIGETTCAVLMIEPKAAYRKKKIETVTIPDTVAWIGKKAFAYCTSLRVIKSGNRKGFSRYLYDIGDYAFYQCRSLEPLYKPTAKGATSPEFFCAKTAFLGCKKFKWLEHKTIVSLRIYRTKPLYPAGSARTTTIEAEVYGKKSPLTWKNSNPKVIKLTVKGEKAKVRALKPGRSTVTVTTKNGARSSYTVVVKSAG